MTTTQTIPTRPTPKVAVVTGASQGIGAGVVAAYRKLGWAVVATSRSIPVSDDPGLITVQGDVADPVTADRVIADIVDAIVFLEHAGFVTGEILHVDGGMSAGH